MVAGGGEETDDGPTVGNAYSVRLHAVCRVRGRYCAACYHVRSLAQSFQRPRNVCRVTGRYQAACHHVRARNAQAVKSSIRGVHLPYPTKQLP